MAISTEYQSKGLGATAGGSHGLIYQSNGCIKESNEAVLLVFNSKYNTSHLRIYLQIGMMPSRTPTSSLRVQPAIVDLW